MKESRIRTLESSAIAVAAIAALAVAVPASAAEKSSTSLIIDTQFVDGPSAIIEATGPLVTCSAATTLLDPPQERTRNQTAFSGFKVLTCGSATVTIGWQAFITDRSGRKTFGDWWVVSSNLPGVSSGGGKLMGDSATCTPAPGSPGCITDVFTGFVS